jgi:DNA-binding NtrC family response regulator
METGTGATARPSPRVLLVIKENAEARRISLFLQEQGLETVVLRDDQAGYNLLDTDQVDALIVETRSQHIDGLRLLRVARMRNPDVCTILLAGPNDLDLATRALDDGAHDFQTRPINLEKILAVIRRALSVQRLVGEMHEMAQRLDRKLAFRNLIGSSAPFVRAYNRILYVCGVDAPVLIIGESGTGRKLVAGAIHQNSARRAANLVTIDCEGIDAGFLEKEIFGEEVENARPRPGRVELAEGGTLVIDEIGAVPLSIQGRLLRMVRDREFERTGGRKTRRADVRVIAIGSVSLRGKVDQGVFRADLYDNLRAATIEMPPLRHRKRDIPLLAEHFLEEAGAETDRSISGIKPAAMDRLRNYTWPGNVRELKSVIRGIVLSAPGAGPIDVSDLPEEIRAGGSLESNETIPIRVGSTLADAERGLIEATLKTTEGDRVRAAEILGIGLRTLQRRLAGYRRFNR